MKWSRSSPGHPSLRADASGAPFMPSELTLVKPVALPPQSAVATVYESMNLADAFCGSTHSGLVSTLGGQLTVSTVVRCHDLLGRACISVMLLFIARL